MASKRSAAADESKSKKIKRQVSKETFSKWQKVHECEFQVMSWLRCTVDRSDKSLVSTLWCEVCRKYERKIDSKKNFSRAWIDGSTNHKTSNVVDHTSNEQHKAAMALLRQEQAKNASEPVASYSTIACCLHNPSIGPATRERIKKKFDITYLMAKENLPFTKYPAIHDLLERHGVQLGFSYKTRESAHSFAHFIAESLKSYQSLKKLSLQDPLQWPTVKVVRSKIVDEDGSKTYQGVCLKKYTDSTVQSCKD